MFELFSLKITLNTESVCSFLQRLDWEEPMVILTSTQTVEQTNQGVPKPSLQVKTHTQAENMLSQTLIITHSLYYCLSFFLLPQVNLILCVTTSARCFCSCALWTEPAASQVTPARLTATSWMGGVCSVRPLNLHPVLCLVSEEMFTGLWTTCSGDQLELREE